MKKMTSKEKVALHRARQSTEKKEEIRAKNRIAMAAKRANQKKEEKQISKEEKKQYTKEEENQNAKKEELCNLTTEVASIIEDIIFKVVDSSQNQIVLECNIERC